MIGKVFIKGELPGDCERNTFCRASDEICNEDVTKYKKKFGVELLGRIIIVGDPPIKCGSVILARR